MLKIYTLNIPKTYADAIFWHGYRYATTDYLCAHMHQDDNEVDWKIELEENEAWVLMEHWQEEDCQFACGSPELNNWFNEFMDTIV